MKFLCDYCGNVIDTNEIKSGGCPICNAPLANNKEWVAFQRNQERMNDFAVEQERIKTEERQFQFDTKKEMYEETRKDAKKIKKGAKIIITIAAVFVSLSILGTIIMSFLVFGGIGATTFTIFQSAKQQMDDMEQSKSSLYEHNIPQYTFEHYNPPH